MRIVMLGVKGIPYTGGIEKVVEELGSRLVSRGHEVTAYVRPHYSSKRVDEYKGIRLFPLPSVRTKSLDAITHTLLSAVHSLSLRADIIHIHSIGLSIFSRLAKLNGSRTVVQSHGLDWQRGKWGAPAKMFLRLTDYSTVHFPDATTVVSRKLKKYYETRFRTRVHYIPNGVNIYKKLEPREIHEIGIRKNGYILFASRLVPEKGCHYLIRAYQELKNPSKKLVIAGDSNYGDKYARQLKALASDNIIFLGFVQGRLFEELMSNAFIYVQPSEIEGLSTALLQAMSYGNCVVVSDIEENLEVVQNFGWSFGNGEYEDLKRVVEYLLKNEDMVREKGRLAREHVRRYYGWDRVVDQYEALYESLLR